MSQAAPYKLILVPFKDRYRAIRAKDILYIKSADNYCRIITSTGHTYTLRKTLKEIEKTIAKIPTEEARFFRIHDQHIISLKEDIDFNRQCTVVYFTNGDWLPVSRTYHKQLREQLELL